MTTARPSIRARIITIASLAALLWVGFVAIGLWLGYWAGWLVAGLSKAVFL